MSSTFKCMSVNPVDKCMSMKIGVQVWKIGKKTHQIRVHITNFYDTIKKDLSYYMQLIKEFFFLQINWKNILHITYTGIVATWVEKS